MTRPHQLHEMSLVVVMLVNFLHVVYMQKNRVQYVVCEQKCNTWYSSIRTGFDLHPQVWLEPKHEYPLSEKSQNQTARNLLVSPASSSLCWDITDHWSSKWRYIFAGNCLSEWPWELICLLHREFILLCSTSFVWNTVTKADQFSFSFLLFIAFYCRWSRAIPHGSHQHFILKRGYTSAQTRFHEAACHLNHWNRILSIRYVNYNNSTRTII